jgi:hypothetical protein
MVASAEGIARRPHVVRTLSESFAVIANRKHTLAVRNCAKFRGVFGIFGGQTLFSRQTFVTIRQTFATIERFWEITGRMMEQTWYYVSLSSRPVKCSQKPLVVSCRLNGKPFMAKWQTFLTKHNGQRRRRWSAVSGYCCCTVALCGRPSDGMIALCSLTASASGWLKSMPWVSASPSPRESPRAP